jgi:hypothetical protein
MEIFSAKEVVFPFFAGVQNMEPSGKPSFGKNTKME